MQTFDEIMKKDKRERGQFVGVELDKQLYNEFVEFSNKYGRGAKRKIFETALKDFLQKQRQ